MALKSSLDKEEFRFIWKIENFSLCENVQGKSISSPTFSMGMLEKTEWSLKLYPRGQSDSHVSCDLYRESDSGPSSITVHWQFSLVIVPGMPKFEFNSGSKAFTRGTYTTQKLISRETLLKRKHVFMPMDTLTVQCDLWTEISDTATLEMTPEVKSLVSCLYDGRSHSQGFKFPNELCELTNREVRDLKKNLQPYLNELVARTRICVERGTFTWPIRRFSSLVNSKKAGFSIPFPSKRLPPFAVIVSIQTDGKVQIDIRKLIGGDVTTLFVICRIAVLDIDGRTHLSNTNEHTYANPKSEETWSFPSFFNKKTLTDNRRLCLPNDQLTLRFEFEASTGVEFNQVEEYSFVSLNRISNQESEEDTGTIGEDLVSFYDEGRAHDFNLKVKDKLFPAHRAVLCFRSPVFCAMLDLDTAEKSSGEVDLSDMDHRTVSRMLEFMYTDQVELVHVDATMKLFEAADKYHIRSLRRKCTDFLKNHLTRDNVFGVYCLADRHQDKELMQFVLEFLFKPPYESLISAEFDNFIPGNTTLARKIMQSWIRTLQVLDESSLSLTTNEMAWIKNIKQEIMKSRLKIKENSCQKFLRQEEANVESPSTESPREESTLSGVDCFKFTAKHTERVTVRNLHQKVRRRGKRKVKQKETIAESPKMEWQFPTTTTEMAMIKIILQDIRQLRLRIQEYRYQTLSTQTKVLVEDTTESSELELLLSLPTPSTEMAVIKNLQQDIKRLRLKIQGHWS